MYQDPQGFCFSIDAVLLACFAPIEPGMTILDGAVGNGVLPLLLLAREPNLDITGLEIWKDTAKLAAFNMAANKVDVEIIYGDMMKAAALFGKANFDCLITNPPYYKKDSVRLGKDRGKNMAKVELAWDTPTFFRQCHKVLTDTGQVITCYPAPRHKEILPAAHNAGFGESKRVWIKATAAKEPYLVLSCWAKDKSTPCREQILILKDKDGTYTPAMAEILKERAWRY